MPPLKTTKTPRLKPFHQQFCECSAQGLTELTKFVPFNQHPKWMPAFPTPDMKKQIVQGKWRGIELILCGRFDGYCSTANPQCRKLREAWKPKKP